MAQHAVITGVPRAPTQATPPTRREINDFVKDNMQFSLFIQALQAMYKTSQKDGLSHFQIGGIHGWPFQQWETSGGARPAGQWGGYCTHGSMLFPTWHRPYVATYEQTLQAHAVEIAKTYTTSDKAQWQNAALNLRLPYWDWASNAVPPTQVISDARVTITGPDGKQTPVANPLLAYPFNPLDPSVGSPYSQWPTTLRHPTSNRSNAQSNVKEMIQWLQSDAQSIRTSTYNLLTRVSTWPAFSNHTPGDGGSSSSSLEAIHDGIHGDVGADGHMGDPFVAAFDPIFFLHHCNVDRILALWEALHPTTWVASGPANGGTFTMAGNATETATTDLTPFWNGATTYWNSNACRDFEKSLNYTYPEFAGLSGQDANTVRAKIGALVNQLYGASSRRTFAFAAAGAQGATGQAVAPAAEKILIAAQHTAAAPPAAMKLFAAPAASPAATPATTPAAAPAGSQVHVQIAGGGDRKYNDWSARIHAKKFELRGSYSVLIFLGPVPDDPNEWRASPSYVGAHHVFANSRMEDCENCRRNNTENVEGFVPLNEAIAAHSGLNSFDPAVVEPYLKKELSWRVQMADRSSVDLSQLPSLQVVVVALPLHLHEGEMFPKTGTPVHHHGITEAKYFKLKRSPTSAPPRQANFLHNMTEYCDWTARIRFNKYELGGSFSVLVFLGEIPDDPAEWRSAPNYVGSHRAFVSVGSGDSRNDSNAITEGFVPLNSAIASKSGLNSYDPKEVVPYLQRNLGWRIQKADRSPVDVSEVPSLQIVVIATPMRMKEGEPFPEQCGDPKHHHEVTSGKPGGCYE